MAPPMMMPRPCPSGSRLLKTFLKSNALSFYVTKTVLVGPKWFWSDQQNEMVTTKMNWSGPNVIHSGIKSQLGPDQFNLVVTNSIWSWPFYFGRDQIIMVKSKSIWSDQNHLGPTKTVFGHIEGQGILKSFYSRSFLMYFNQTLFLFQRPN